MTREEVILVVAVTPFVLLFGLIVTIAYKIRKSLRRMKW